VKTLALESVFIFDFQSCLSLSTFHLLWKDL
jgi:hypothetical protein